MQSPTIEYVTIALMVLAATTLVPLAMLLMFTTFIGGCAGSTAGGMKVIRWLLVLKQGSREVARLIHPSAQVAVKLGDKPVGPRVVEAVWGFFAVALVVLTLLLLSTITSWRK